MTKVDFYVLHGQQALELGDQFACRLTDKAFRQGKRVLIKARSQQHAQQLDDLLWQQPKTGFIPHAMLSTLPSKVNIDYNAGPGEHDDCLINLGDEIPEYCARFQRICEIVVFNEQARMRSREHYKYYKDRGFPIATHNIK